MTEIPVEDKRIRIFMDPIQISYLAIELSQFDGIDLEILEDYDLPIPDDTKEHGLRSLGPTDIATLIVSISGLITSLTAVASLILDARSRAKKIKTGDKENTQEPHIVINNFSINISTISTPKELATILEEQLKIGASNKNTADQPSQED